MDGYPGNTACNSDAFIDQVGATVMHTQAASGLPNWHYRAIDLPINPNIIQGLASRVLYSEFVPRTHRLADFGTSS